MVCLVRSEDRKPSRRVFPLLQNLDLDSVTFSQIQSTGDPISIEDMNEQEMIDLIIVNLARLAVAGEWDGLLEAGAGAVTWQNTADYNAASGYGGKFWNLAIQAPIYCGSGSVTTVNFNEDYQFYNPFIAPFTGAPAACNINVTVATSSQNLYVGFYSGTDGIPATMLGYATIATNSTGVQRVTSFTEASTGSLTFTAGSMYYYSVSKAGTEDPTVTTAPNGSTGQVFSGQAALVTANQVLGVMSDTEITSAPADVAADDLWNGGSGWTYRVFVWLEA